MSALSNTKASVDNDCVVCFEPTQLNNESVQCQVCNKFMCGSCYNKYTQHFNLRKLDISTNIHNDEVHYHFKNVQCPHCKQDGLKKERDTVLRSDTHDLRIKSFIKNISLMLKDFHTEIRRERKVSIIENIMKKIIDNLNMIKTRDNTKKKIMPVVIKKLKELIEEDKLIQLNHYLWLIQNNM